jgi:xylulokinase
VAAVGVGAYKSVPEACKAIIRVKEQSKPAKKSVAFYDEQYKKYAALYPALKGWFCQ